MIFWIMLNIKNLTSLFSYFEIEQTMSTDNPFATPSEEPIPAHILPDSATAPGKPGGLLAFCIISIVLASFGLLSSMGSAFSIVAGEAMQNAFQPAPSSGPENEMVQVQEEMNAEIMAVSQSFSPILIGLVIAQVGCCSLLLASSIGTLRLRPAGRVWLVRACTATIVFEIIRAVPTSLMAFQNHSIMKKYMPRIMRASMGEDEMQGGEQFAQTMGSFASAMVIIVLIFTVVWLTVKVVFYLLEIRYLQRPATRQLFGSPEFKHEEFT